DDRTSSAAALRWVSPLPRPPVRPCTRERSSSRTSSTGDQRGRAPLLARSGAPAARAREAPFVWAGRAHRAPRGPCADGCGVRRLLGVDRPAASSERPSPPDRLPPDVFAEGTSVGNPQTGPPTASVCSSLGTPDRPCHEPASAGPPRRGGAGAGPWLGARLAPRPSHLLALGPRPHRLRFASPPPDPPGPPAAGAGRWPPIAPRGRGVRLPPRARGVAPSGRARLAVGRGSFLPCPTAWRPMP
ncbi:unnamed protein product, partial [Prorocentrum cordatum]